MPSTFPRVLTVAAANVSILIGREFFTISRTKQLLIAVIDSDCRLPHRPRHSGTQRESINIQVMVILAIGSSLFTANQLEMVLKIIITAPCRYV